MIDKRLKYKDIKGQKHMLAYITPGEAKQLEKLGGQKTMTKEGIPAYPPSNDARGQSTGTSTSGSTSGGGGNTNREKGIMSQYSGPKGTTGNTNDFSDDGGVDRSAVGQFSTYGKNLMNQNLKGPSLFSNITGGIKDYVMGGGLLGMGIRGLGSLVDKFTGPKAVDYNDGHNMANIAGPVTGPPAQREGDDNQGIMAAYTPNMLNVSGEVVDEVPVSQEEEDFTQRFRVANQFRQDKQGQLDSAILEMISKLYT